MRFDQLLKKRKRKKKEKQTKETKEHMKLKMAHVPT